MARPGESLFGSQIRETSGSFWRAKTRPLHDMIPSASSVWTRKERKKVNLTIKIYVISTLENTNQNHFT